jgi:Xaa-Pro aminopeptidase
MALLSFSRDEYDGRLRQLHERMDTLEVDVVVVDEVEHIGYLTGYVPTAATYQSCIIPRSGSPTMILRALDESTFREQSWLDSYVMFRDWDDPVELLVEVLKKQGFGRARIGQERDSHFLLVQRYEAIAAGLPDASLVDFSKVLWELRLRKSPAEVDCHRRAAAIADSAFRDAIAFARPGTAEREIAATLYSSALIAGADNTRLALLMSGPRTDALHGALGARILTDGDLLHIELVPHYHGYTSRLMRPTAIGKASAETVRVAENLIAIQNDQISAMRPGARAADVDRICREQVLASGLRTDYPNATGYTLGYIAQPRTSDLTRAFLPTAEWLLEEGMVFHMYTWARGLAFSDTILITQDGCERLTTTPRRLFQGGG